MNTIKHKDYLKSCLILFTILLIFSCEEEDLLTETTTILEDTVTVITEDTAYVDVKDVNELTIEDSINSFLTSHNMTLEDIEVVDSLSLQINTSISTCSQDYPDNIAKQSLSFINSDGLLHLISLYISEDVVISDSLTMADGEYYFASAEDNNYQSSFTIDDKSILFYPSNVTNSEDLENINDGLIIIENLDVDTLKVTVLLSYGDDNTPLAFIYSGEPIYTETVCSDE